MTDTRWRPAVLAALAASLIGLLVGEPAFLTLAIVPLGYVLFSSASGIPDAEIRVERRVDDDRPQPGSDVTVTVTIENSGTQPVSDVRVADAPPLGVPVTGTTKIATALRPGETATLEYVLNLPRGEFDFGTPAVAVRNLAGTADRSVVPSVTGTTSIVCQTLLDAVPLQDYTIRYVGRTPTDAGGAGVEFYATREYQRGDPVNRINWRRYARTGELSTVDLREERAMTVVFLIDDRETTQRSQPGYGPDSLDLAIYASSRGLSTLLDENHRVGVALLSQLADSAGYVTPGSGPTVQTAAQNTFERARSDTETSAGVEAASTATNPTVDGEPAGETTQPTARSDGGNEAMGDEEETPLDGEAAARQLAARLPPRAQVVCCTALTDDIGEDLADVLTARGYALTILSPDMTTGTAATDVTPAAEIESIQRTVRLRRLQRRGVPVVDWSLEAPLALALAQVFDTGGRTL